MRRRYCSLFTYCPPDGLLRQAVIEIESESGMVTDLFLLGRSCPESAQTLFVDGVLSGEIRSLKQSLPTDRLLDICERYYYIDLSSGKFPHTAPPAHKPLLLDFGTTSLADINRLLSACAPFLSQYSLIEFFSACVYRPALELGDNPAMAAGHPVRLHQWKGVDLARQKITGRTRVGLVV